MPQTYIIAEAGVNHNGNLPLALQLCDAALSAGANAVKFQTFITDKSITLWSEMADYQKTSTGNVQSQYEMIKKLELSFDQFKTIKAHCDNIGIQFLSTPDDEDSLEFLLSLGLQLIKVGSSEITNLPFLRSIGKKGKNVILSTGMSNLLEIRNAYSILLDYGAPSVAILHCTSEYPCPFAETNLLAIPTLKASFDTEIGFSDHTTGIITAPAAVALGTSIIEKHLTLNKSMDGPDHSSSIEPAEFKSMAEAIRIIELSLGDGRKLPTPAEIKNLPVVRRSIVAARAIDKGEVYNVNNIAAKRPGMGISPMLWDQVIGQKAIRSFSKDELIEL